MAMYSRLDEKPCVEQRNNAYCLIFDKLSKLYEEYARDCCTYNMGDFMILPLQQSATYNTDNILFLKYGLQGNLLLEFSVDVGAFVIGMSQISSFFSCVV